MEGAMTRPIPDKAEVALEYPDKLYIGTFERSSRFDAHLDQSGVSLTLDRTGSEDVRKSVRMHFHYALFADILRELARFVPCIPSDDEEHRNRLRAAAEFLYRSLIEEPTTDTRRLGADKDPHSSGRESDEISKLTSEEKEVLLLHVLE